MGPAKILLVSFLALLCSGCVAGFAEQSPYEQPQTGVYGQVQQADGPAAGAWVYAYRDRLSNFRGPADYAARVEADGHYVLDLLPGAWYLIGRHRPQGSIDGPPRSGDAWAVHPDNPLTLTEGKPLRVDFHLAGVNQQMLLRGNSLASGDTGFRGRLLDGQGAVVSGAIAMAYVDSDFQRMPDYTSPAVAEAGRFTLYVPESGRYCLAARQRTRGQPVQGELYGTLGKGAAACVNVRQGEIIDVGDIRLTPYLR